MKDFTNGFGWQKLPSEVMRNIALKGKNLRKKKKLSQAELAKRSGVSLGSLKRFETSGRISLESLLKLAYTLKSLEEFEQLFPMDDTPETLDDLFKKT